MNFPRLETPLKHSPERVRAALLGKELEPYFKKSGWFTQGSAGRGIRWHREPDESLLGKVGYFRAKNISVFRFKVQLEPSGPGTRAVLLVQHGPFSPFLRFLAYAIGLCMFLVGVVFVYLGDKAMERGLRKVLEYLERHLKMWDEAA